MADNEDSAQNTATTQQPLPREYISGYEDTTLSVMQHDLNILIPWCSVGICSLFLDLSWPGWFGFGYACDCCCCSSEWGVCRILCEEGDCCQRSGNCDAFPPPSNVNLKRTPNDWCSVMQEEFSCGDFKTFCAFKTEQCCCQQRLAIPTNSIKSTPWMVNCLGFTLCYQWSYPMACCVDVKGLKEMTQGNINVLVHFYLQKNLLTHPALFEF